MDTPDFDEPFIIRVMRSDGPPGMGLYMNCTVGEVDENSPEMAAGIQVNDRIIAVNGHAVENRDELLSIIKNPRICPI